MDSLHISIFKMKYEKILKNVTKFNQEKEKLNDLLSYQKMSHNHYGLGFLNQSEKSIHVIIHIILLWKEILILFQKELRISSYGFLKT